MNFKVNGIDVVITQKKMKHIRLRVCPPNGVVKVSAPKKMRMDSIHGFITSKFEWIKHHQDKMCAITFEQSKDYSDGEKHYFNGQCFLLKIVACEKKPQVTLLDSHIVMAIHPDANALKKQALLDVWYREQLKEKTASLIAHWEKVMSVSVARFSIRSMKTRWGSCSPQSRAIRISSALAKKSFDCLEYVVIHELAHLIEPSHNRRFIAVMDQFLPSWRLCRRKLNSVL